MKIKNVLKIFLRFFVVKTESSWISCPSNWTLVGDICCKDTGLKKNWTNAVKECKQRFNATLPVFYNFTLYKAFQIWL